MRKVDLNMKEIETLIDALDVALREAKRTVSQGYQTGDQRLLNANLDREKRFLDLWNKLRKLSKGE